MTGERLLRWHRDSAVHHRSSGRRFEIVRERPDKWRQWVLYDGGERVGAYPLLREARWVAEVRFFALPGEDAA